MIILKSIWFIIVFVGLMAFWIAAETLSIMKYAYKAMWIEDDYEAGCMIVGEDGKLVDLKELPTKTLR